MSEIKIWESSLQKGHKKLLSVYSGNSDSISKETKAKALQELGFAYQFISDNEQLQRCAAMGCIGCSGHITGAMGQPRCNGLQQAARANSQWASCFLCSCSCCLLVLGAI